MNVSSLGAEDKHLDTFAIYYDSLWIDDQSIKKEKTFVQTYIRTPVIVVSRVI